MRALSIVYGIEPYVVLKDVWNSSDREIEGLSRWILDALLDAAMRDARKKATRKPGRPGNQLARRSRTAAENRARTSR